MISEELFKHAIKIIILVFLVSTMFSVGSGLTLKEITGPFRNIRLLISSLVTSYLLVPLIAIIVTRLIPIEEPLRHGLVLFSLCAGAEAGPKIAGISRANVAYSVGLLVLQLVFTVLIIPILLQLLLPDVHIATGKLLLKLLLGVAFPLLLGLFMKARFETVTGRLNPVAHKISSVFLVLMAVALIINYVNDIIQLIGSGALPVALIFIICSFMTGYLMGGSGKDTRLTLAFMSGGRNAGICLVIAGQVFTDQKVIWMVITTMILMLILLIPASFVAGHFNAGKHKSPAGN